MNYLTSTEIAEYLRSNGFTVGLSRHPLQHQGNSWPLNLAQKDEIGVSFRWVKCDGTDNDLRRALHVNGCPFEEHVHIAAAVRTGAGGRYNSYNPAFIPHTFETLNGYRGAPSERKQISRGALPEPYQFRTDRFLVSGKRYSRTGVIASAELVDIVGIQDNARIDAEMAAKPGEPVWFHFDCIGYAGATFDIITNGDVWYPINRKSRRITTQMKPKKSVDLTGMSVLDQEFLLAVMQDFATKM